MFVFNFIGQLLFWKFAAWRTPNYTHATFIGSTWRESLRMAWRCARLQRKYNVYFKNERAAYNDAVKRWKMSSR